MILATALFMAFTQSCKPEPKDEDPGILAYAVCEMDIQSQNRAKSVDVVGDSQSVHQLAVYACAIFGEIDSNWIMGPIDCMEYYFYGIDQSVFARDTVNHVFSFMHDAVIGFDEFDYPEGKPIGVPGTEYLGWLACYIEPVFCAYYDTVRKCYVNPSVDSRDFRTPDCRMDTLGYVPMDMMARNRERLLQLMAEQRFQEMIDLYKTEYRIYTCTGEEYDEIVRRRQEKEE